MKKKIAVAAVLLSLLSISAMGTLAYFTDSGVAHNVITSGKIDIELNDTFNLEQPIVPSQEIEKIVSVSNTDNSNSAWVRILLHTSIVKNDTNEPMSIYLENGDPVMKIDIIENGKWKAGDKVEVDGVQYDSYVYQDSIPAGATTEDLFITVTFDEDTGNEYQNCTVYIDVIAQAVQSDNNPNMDGWPSEEVNN